jgi:2,3-bisphosphoglycerate-independent phosphoglycerate mutase
LRAILAQNNLFHQVRALGLSAEFANAYPPFFLERLERGKARRTATMQAALAAGVRIRDRYDLREGRALSGLNLTNSYWRERFAPVPLITPRDAGRNLMRLARENDFTAFEYAPTDMAGHKNDHVWIMDILSELDELWNGALEELDPRDTLLVITSDHGNIEDWTRKGHTLNPVPTILVGAHAADLAPRIKTLVDITPTIVDTLRESG